MELVFITIAFLTGYYVLCGLFFFLVSSDGYVRGLSAGRAAQPIEEVSGHLSGLVEV